MKAMLLCAATAIALCVSGLALAEPVSPKSDKGASPKPPPKPVDKEKPKPPPEEDDQESAVTCTLLTKEAPRGGRLEVQGAKLGKSPVVKIGGAITRIIERPGDTIAVQIPRKSNGGEVVVRVEGTDVPCGTLTIIGLD